MLTIYTNVLLQWVPYIVDDDDEEDDDEDERLFATNAMQCIWFVHLNMYHM